MGIVVTMTISALPRHVAICEGLHGTRRSPAILVWSPSMDCYALTMQCETMLVPRCTTLGAPKGTIIHAST
jgi:hypothetical protein